MYCDIWSIHFESHTLQGMGECIDIPLMVNSYGKSQMNCMLYNTLLSQKHPLEDLTMLECGSEILKKEVFLQGLGECIEIPLMVNSYGKSQFTGNGRMYGDITYGQFIWKVAIYREWDTKLNDISICLGSSSTHEESAYK